MAAYVEKEKTPFDGLLSAGDNFYVPLNGVDDPVWQDLFEKMYDARRLNFPFYISLGNHDYSQKKYLWELAYAKQHPESRWKLPSRWYRLDLPAKEPLVTVIMLDSDHDFMPKEDWLDEKKFLEDELAKPRAAWTICCAHHPLFSNGAAANNGILQADWGTLFKKYNVDIYLAGHDHNLQHLEIPGWPTTFILSGGGGAHAAPLLRDNRGFSRVLYGFTHLDFTPEQVTVRYISSTGETVHEFVRTKAGEVRITLNTPSDAAVTKPLEVIQGLYDRIHGPQTQPATGPTTMPTAMPTTLPSTRPNR